MVVLAVAASFRRLRRRCGRREEVGGSGGLVPVEDAEGGVVMA